MGPPPEWGAATSAVTEAPCAEESGAPRQDCRGETAHHIVRAGCGPMWVLTSSALIEISDGGSRGRPA